MLEEITPFEDMSGIDNLNELEDTGYEFLSQIEDTNCMSVEPIEVDPTYVDPIEDSSIDSTSLKLEINDSFSYKRAICTCSCDLSCTIGY